MIDRAWPALPLLALGLAVVVALVGVLAAPSPTEIERIDDTVHEVAQALAERRGEDACALMTPATRQAVAARLGTLDCAATVRSFGIGIDADRLRRATVTDATVTGDRARVAREQLVLADGAPFGGDVELQLVGGEWRVAGFGRA